MNQTLKSGTKRLCTLLLLLLFAQHNSLQIYIHKLKNKITY